jgi:hypothetical protein
MIDSPNDMDPPDYVVGNPPEEALYEAIYEKFPWLEPGTEARGLLDLPERIRAAGVDELLEFVINESVKWGQDNAQSDMGEYMDHKIEELERQNTILKNQRDRMVQVNLGIEKGLAPQTDDAWLEWER